MKVLEILLMRLFKDTHFVLQKSTYPQSILCGVQDFCMALSGTVKVWITASFQTLFLQM